MEHLFSIFCLRKAGEQCADDNCFSFERRCEDDFMESNKWIVMFNASTI